MRRWMTGLVVLLLVATCGLARTHYIKTNTATKIVVGPFYDGTDHETPETGLTVGDIDCELSWDNAGTPVLVELTLTASGGDNDCALLTGSENGLYTLELTAANVNYLGTGTITFRDPNNTFDSFSENLLARPANVHDSLIAGTDYLDGNAVQVGGTTPLAAADIKAECDTALSDIGLDHLLSAAVTGADVANDSIIAKLVSGSATADWDDYTNTTDSLAALNDDLDSIITLSTPPPGDVDLSDFIQDFVVASGSTPRSVVITVSAGDDAIPSNFWKDHMAVFYDATLSSDRGAQWRKIIGNTASSSGTVTLRLDKALDFTPADTTDYVYIVGLDQVAEGYVR